MEQSAPKNICRVCMTEDSKFLSVFTSDETVGFKIHLSEMIGAFCAVQITLGDGLPEEICSKCAENTVNMYKFKLKCEETDRILRKRLKENIPSGNDSEEFEKQNNVNEFDDRKDVCKEEVQLVNEGIMDDFMDFNSPNHDTDSDEGIPEDVAEVDVSKASKKPKTIECEICFKRFSRHDLLLRHKIAHAMKLDHEQVEVETQYQVNDENNDNTIIIKTEEVLFSCQECDNIFLHKEDLDGHLEGHLKTNFPLACEICLKRFRRQSHLNRHIKTHLALKPHVCPKCGKGYARQEQLNHHMNSHSGVKPHVCQICFKGFNQISNLKDHIRTHNGEKPFLCPTCGKGFNQLGNLRQHTIRHSGIKAHLCNTCGNGFASKGELQAHLRKHTGARPFVCPVCGHGFTTSSSLTKHKRIHSGEKPYECDVCRMKFSRSGILARHKRTHTGEKPYKCTFCGKAFSQSNDLTSHHRIHTGEKPYICDECGQAFRQSSALKTHKKTHTTFEEKDFEEKAVKIIETKSVEFVETKPVIVHPTILSAT